MGRQCPQHRVPIKFMTPLKNLGISPQRHRGTERRVGRQCPQRRDFKLDLEKINFLMCKVEFGSLGIRVVELKLTTDPSRTQDKFHELVRKKVKNQCNPCVVWAGSAH